MPEEHAWVALVECQDVTELHAVRAALEGHGVPCRVEGEHTHGILGSFHGSMVRSRVLVPQPALVVARQLTADIVGPYDEGPPPPEEAADESPFRRSADEAADGDGPASVEAAPVLRPKSFARLLIVVFLVVAPLFGLAHIYAGKPRRAGVLALLTLVALPQALDGAGWARMVLACIWVADLLGASLLIAEHNGRAHEAQRIAELAANDRERRQSARTTSSPDA